MTSAVQPSITPVGVAGTTLVHGALIMAALLAARSAHVAPEIVYEVNLVAAPAPEPAVHNVASEATPAAPEHVAPSVVPKPVVPARKVPPPAAAKRADQAPVTHSAVTPAPGERPSTGQDVVTLHQAGIQFPFPEYLHNIENRIFAQWNHAMFRPGFDTKIAFVILKDGSVDARSIEVVKGSGNYSFDLNARAAIDAAVAAHAFGPLPSGFNSASLPILFDFQQVARSEP